jgi:hypothetical protein
MPLDTRTISNAMQRWPQPDALGSMQRGMASGYQLQAAEQANQLNALKLAEAAREEQERGTLAQAFRGALTTDPATGQTRVDIPRAFSEAYRTTSDPLTVFKAQQSYEKSQGESRKSALEAKKLELEQRYKGLEFGGQIAQGIEARIAAGANPQEAWDWGLATMKQAGMPTEGISPFYDANMLAGWKGQAVQIKDQLDYDNKVISNQLREYELAETQKRTAIEREGLGIRREDVAARREETVERRAERQQQRETQASGRTFEQEDKLRNDFIAQTKPYQVQSDFYGRIETAAKDPSAAGDLALIYSFMKLLDPGSTVLAGEYATAANAGSIPERIYSQYNRLLSGELLGDAEKGTIRKDYLDRARRIYEQSTKDYQRTKAVFDDRARRYHLDPANVTQDLGSTAAGAAGSAGSTGSGPHAGTPLEQLTPAQRAERKAWLKQQLGSAP